jgi:DKNYY family
MSSRNTIVVITILVAFGVALFAVNNGFSIPLYKAPRGDAQPFFSKDAHHAFYLGAVIQGADASTFTALTDSEDHPTLFSKDAMHIYVSDPQSRDTHILQNADPTSFTVLISLTVSCVPNRQSCDGDFPFSVILAKDKHAVYGELGGLIAEADATSFEDLKTPDGSPSVYTQDENHTYAGSIAGGDAKVISVDRATFHVISATEARDRNNLYFEGNIVSE